MLIVSHPAFGQVHDSFTTASIKFDKGQYEIAESAVVTVVDADMNVNEGLADNFYVAVWSDSDPAGIMLQLSETGDSTNTFTGTLSFTATDSSALKRLRVALGDTITASYDDHTPDGLITIKAESLISGGIIEQTPLIDLKNIKIVDPFGNEIERVYTNKQVMVSADVVSLSENTQEYYLVFRVKNSSGSVVAGTEWNNVPLQSFQTLNNAFSWTPTEPGKYTATISVQDAYPNGVELADPLSLVVIVAQLEPINKPPTAKISADVNELDAGNSVKFSASSSYDPDGTIMTYGWDFGDGDIASGESVMHTYSSAGKYTATLTVSDNENAKGVDHFAVTVLKKNLMPVAVANGLDKINVGSDLSLSASDSYDPDGGTITRYEWDFGDGNKLEGKEVTYSYSNSGTYSITLTVTDDENSQSSTAVPISVESPVPTGVILAAGGGGAAAAVAIAVLTQTPKPIPNYSTPQNMTLSVRVNVRRVL